MLSIKVSYHRGSFTPTVEAWSWKVGFMLLGLGMWVVGIMALVGCDKPKPTQALATYAPYTLEDTVVWDTSSWSVGDCYVDSDDLKKLQMSATPPPPWETAESIQDDIHWRRLIAEWDLVDGGTMHIFYQHAYSNRREMPWFTTNGKLWTVTPSDLNRYTKMPCPKRSLEDLRAKGIEIAGLVKRRETP